MSKQQVFPRAWRGNRLSAKVLYSHAGVAQQIMIENGTRFLLIDTGDGTLRDLLNINASKQNLAGILFTHGHFDHMGGLHTILGFLRMIGREDDLPIIAPRGCVEVKSTIDNFNSIYGGSIPFRIEFKEAEPGEVFESGGMKIKTFAMVHCGSIDGGAILDPIPALGYRVTIEDESVAISGDTGDCPGLRALVDEADLAIIEATYEKSSDATSEELAKVHLSEDLATEIAALAKNHMLVHRGRR